MKLKKLPNIPEPFGVKITDIPQIKDMTRSEWRELGKVCMKYLVWVIEDQQMTKEIFSRFCYSWGKPHVVHEDVFARLDSTPDLKRQLIEEMQRMSFDHLPGLGRVTGIRDDKGRTTGIFADGELGWHCNEAGKLNPHPVVLLHAIEGTKNTQTQFIENVTEYQKLTSEDRKFVDSLVCLYKFDGDYITESLNGVSDLQKLIVRLNVYPTDGDNPRPLIQESPGGHRGFCFPFTTFNKFKDKTDQESKEIMDWLKNLLMKDERVYTHNWENNDIVAFDQMVTLHRRPTKDCSKRLLHRIACTFEKIKDYNSEEVI